MCNTLVDVGRGQGYYIGTYTAADVLRNTHTHTHTHTLISHRRKWNPVLWELDRLLYMYTTRVGVCV